MGFTALLPVFYAAVICKSVSEIINSIPPLHNLICLWCQRCIKCLWLLLRWRNPALVALALAAVAAPTEPGSKSHLSHMSRSINHQKSIILECFKGLMESLSLFCTGKYLITRRSKSSLVIVTPTFTYLCISRLNENVLLKQALTQADVFSQYRWLPIIVLVLCTCHFASQPTFEHTSSYRQDNGK